MICKGNTHQNGVKLARYMMTGKGDERAEIFELRGFASGGIEEAFRSVHVMAEGTKCRQPFFHVQVRNQDLEELTREQWLRVANRIESRLGLTDQPRAICFHVDQITGQEHMHVAWSRIDMETMRAVPLPFFKERLKSVARELEIDLGLARVKNEREGPVMAPNRNEFEEARRLGVDIQAVRQGIRDCFDRSDCGRSFEAALAEQGWVLAQGDRRDFVVIDQAGGKHALGKRILGLSAAQTRDRLSDLDRDQLPTVEHAISLVRQQGVGREKTKQEPMRDPHRDEMAWQDALAKAAIEKEKVERRFVEPKPPGESPFAPPKTLLHPMLNRTAPEFWFEDVARQVSRDKKSYDPPEHLKGFALEIWTTYRKSRDIFEFAGMLESKAHLACVTKEEADRSHREAAFAKEIGRFAPVYKEGEIVLVKEPGNLYRRGEEIVEPQRVYRIDKRTTGRDPRAIETFLAPLDRKQLQGIDATKERLNSRTADRTEYWEAIRLENAQRRKDGAPALDNTIRIAPVLGAAERISGKALKTLDVVANTVESLFAPILTPEQKREAAQTARERAAETADKIDLSQYRDQREQARQRQEQEQETTRQRHREAERER